MLGTHGSVIVNGVGVCPTKPAAYATSRVNPDVKRGLWVTEMCQQRFRLGVKKKRKKGPTLGRPWAWGEEEKSLCLPPRSAGDLHLPEKSTLNMLNPRTPRCLSPLNI